MAVAAVLVGDVPAVAGVLPTGDGWSPLPTSFERPLPSAAPATAATTTTARNLAKPRSSDVALIRCGSKGDWQHMRAAG